MKSILTILQKIYVGWAVLWFGLTLLIVFVLLMAGRLLPKRAAHRYSNFILNKWAFVWSTGAFILFRRRDRKRCRPRETSVIVCNHGSFLDTPAVYASVPHLFKTLAKKSLLKAPLMGPIFQTSGIMVDRSSMESRQRSYQGMVEAIRSQTSVLIFPEGTQNRTPELLQDFYEGAFRLAVEMQVPVQPMICLNSRKVMPQNRFGEIRPGPITCVFLDPISTVGLGEKDVDALTGKVRNLMLEALKKHNKA